MKIAKEHSKNIWFVRSHGGGYDYFGDGQGWSSSSKYIKDITLPEIEVLCRTSTTGHGFYILLNYKKIN